MSRKELFRRMRKSQFFMIGFSLSLIIVLLALIAPYIIRFDPEKVNLAQKLIAPEWFAHGLSGHILGTDGVGEDIFSRLLIGSRASLLIAFAGVVIPLIIGSVLGLISGYYGGLVDDIIMRIGDVQMSLPAMMLAIVVMAVLGASTANLVIVVSLSGWVRFARITRASVLSIRDSEFVKASVVLGASDRHILFTQILPNCLTPLIISASQSLGQNVLLEAGLSYLGCGVPLPHPSWGSMISDGRTYITYAPWTVIVPGMALMITVLAFNFLGDGIRDVLDPRNKD